MKRKKPHNTPNNPGAPPAGPTTTPRPAPGGGAAQTAPSRAIATPARATAPAGTYSDTVRVILTY
ncbi:hypothetical protein QMO31_32655 [Pseudomonas aeruginosa]|uniref:hypothetical protein n=1 Tax=Pseudomonas aeruginosa TaxID=287 RepID=UPI0024AFE4FC|nr:hypothetical protein [Pseudomonas aeruginosa]MDI7027785.1 hypothetical protein [Pseudomonas aeruginosa]